MGVRLERAVASFGLDAPDADGLVVGGGEEVLAAGVEHQTAHPVIVANQRDQTLARADVPDLNTAAGRGVRTLSDNIPAGQGVMKQRRDRVS